MIRVLIRFRVVMILLLVQRARLKALPHKRILELGQVMTYLALSRVPNRELLKVK